MTGLTPPQNEAEDIILPSRLETSEPSPSFVSQVDAYVSPVRTAKMPVRLSVFQARLWVAWKDEVDGLARMINNGRNLYVHNFSAGAERDVLDNALRSLSAFIVRGMLPVFRQDSAGSLAPLDKHERSAFADRDDARDARFEVSSSVLLKLFRPTEGEVAHAPGRARGRPPGSGGYDDTAIVAEMNKLIEDGTHTSPTAAASCLAGKAKSGVDASTENGHTSIV